MARVIFHDPFVDKEPDPPPGRRANAASNDARSTSGPGRRLLFFACFPFLWMNTCTSGVPASDPCQGWAAEGSCTVVAEVSA